MRPFTRGIAIAVIHVLLVGSLGAKLLVDRARLPRVWAQTAPVDPNLPIRGRYVQLRLDLPLVGYVAPDPAQKVPNAPMPLQPGVETPSWLWVGGQGRYQVQNGNLALVNDPRGPVSYQRRMAEDRGYRARPNEPLAFFIPDTIPDPSGLARERAQELWVEVTVPKSGPPRPIRLGVKKDGVLTPLNIN